MSTTVRVRDDDKRVLDELQAKIRLRSGERVPLEEVVHRLVKVARDHEDDVVGEDRGPDLTEDEIEEIMGLSWDFGIDTSHETIDDELYRVDWRKDGEEA